MSEIHSILCLSDSRRRSGAALDTAVRLARRTAARLTLADLMEDGRQVVEPIRAERRRQLERRAERCRRQEVDPGLLLLDGDPVRSVAEAVTRHGFDLVVKSPDAATDPALVRRCPAPVWVAREGGANDHAPGAPRRILAAVEPFAWESDFDLNRAVLERAAELADLLDAELHVVSTWTPGPLASLAGSGRLAALEAEARRAQEELVERLPSVSVPPDRLHLAGGAAAEAVPAVARRERADLLVAGSAAREGIVRLLVGNTAERLLRRADRSVLIVRGDDVTPAGAAVESSAA
ncbi:MAG: universal stress protein [Thermoanaerobaculia bacterium]|nr:universal stress protein [Thermoanaerobaculia bacterium]